PALFSLSLVFLAAVPHHLPDLDGAILAARRQAAPVVLVSHREHFIAMTLQRADLRSGRGVPDFDRAVVAGRGKPVAFRTERHGINLTFVSLEDVLCPSGRKVPEANRAVTAGRRQEFA